MKDKIIPAWRFLTDTNYAGIDMYRHNYKHNNAFFSYRNVKRDGSFQYSPNKGSYEIGAALWAMSLNKDIVPSIYLENVVEQIKKPLSENGFWDRVAGNWCHARWWDGQKWDGATPHDSKYSIACQEGALKYQAMGGTGLDEQIAAEQRYLDSHGMAVRPSYNTPDDIGAFVATQQPSGSWYEKPRGVNHDLKLDIGILMAGSEHLDAVEKNLNWLLETHWDPETGGLSWTPESDEYFECHQMWFMIAARMLCDAREG